MNKAQQSVAHIYFLDPSGRPRVGWDNWHDAKVGDKLYAAPPQREWVGLTDDEIDQGLLRSNHALQTAGAWRDGVEWAIKQLKEKNT